MCTYKARSAVCVHVPLTWLMIEYLRFKSCDTDIYMFACTTCTSVRKLVAYRKAIVV